MKLTGEYLYKRYSMHTEIWANASVDKWDDLDADTQNVWNALASELGT